MFLKFEANICRICLQENASKSLFEENENYINEFMYCTNLQISKNDGLPASLCQKCSIRLRSAADFKKQALKSDKFLREFIHKINYKLTKDLVEQTETQDGDDLDDINIEIDQMLEEDGKNESTNSNDIQSDVDETCVQDMQEVHCKSEVKRELDAGISEDTQDNISIIEELSVKDEYEELEIEKLVEDSSSSIEYLEPGYKVSIEYLNADDISEYMEDSSNEGIEVEYVEEEQMDRGDEDDDGIETSNEIFENVNVEETKIVKRRNTDAVKAYGCKICGRAYVSKASLRRHDRTHTEKTPFCCPTCQRCFKTENSLQNHIRLHTVIRPFKCNVCNLRFTRNLLLVNHMRSHTGEKPFKCEDCGETFRNKEILKRHYLNDHKKVYVSTYKCRFCHMDFRGKNVLNNHLKLHREDEKPIYQCEYCERKYLTKAALRSHFDKKHSGKSLYVREELVEQSKIFLQNIIPSYNDVAFRSHFKMSCSDVEELMLDVCEKWYETNIVGRKRLPVEKAVLVTLWILVTKECIRTVSKRFQVHRSGVHVGFLRMCQVFYELSPKYIKWPKGHEADVVAQKFSSIFPEVIGCIGSIHVRISRRANDSAYENHRGEFCVTLQATCNADMIFTDLNVGAPGGMSEADVWKQSNLYSTLKNGEDISPSHHLVGNSHYPLETFLMVPYRENSELTRDQKNYNIAIDTVHRTIKRAFEILKRNFQRAQHLSGRHDKDYKHILTTACIMHNISQQRYPDIEDILVDGPDDSPNNLALDIEPLSMEAIAKRDSIAQSLGYFE